MLSLILIITTLVLFGGFFALTSFETDRGVRFFAPLRERLDQATSHVEFIVARIDLVALVRDEVRHIIERIGHDGVHLSLIIVRAAERTLTRLVRYLRTRQAATIIPRENARAFVKTLSDFKGTLNAEHPEVK